MSNKLINLELVQDKPQLNPFTKNLKEVILLEGPLDVWLRDGTLVRVEYRGEEDGEDYEGFYCFSDEFTGIWELNGKSVTSRDFDIVARPI